MKNPITFSNEYNKFYIWVSYWGVKIMKYFETPGEAVNYIKSNPKRCMDIKAKPNNEMLQAWEAELQNIVIPSIEKQTTTHAQTTERSAISLWWYVLAFLAIFLINFLASPNTAIVTLISSVTQAIGLLIVAFFFVGIKKLFNRGK